MTYDGAWSPALPGAPAGAKKGTVAIGDQERIPLSFALPADLAPGQYKLKATVNFGTGETQEDSFAINVLARPKASPLGCKIALFDPKGETAKLLDAMKVPYQAVDANADLAGYDILVIGKGALTVDGACAGCHARAGRIAGDRLRADFGRAGEAAWLPRDGVRAEAGLQARAGPSAPGRA